MRKARGQDSKVITHEIGIINIYQRSLKVKENGLYQGRILLIEVLNTERLIVPVLYILFSFPLRFPPSVVKEICNNISPQNSDYCDRILRQFISYKLQIDFRQDLR